MAAWLYGLITRTTHKQWARLEPIGAFSADDALQVGLMAVERFAPGVLQLEQEVSAIGMAIEKEASWRGQAVVRARRAVLNEYARLRHRRFNGGHCTYFEVPEQLVEETAPAWSADRAVGEGDRWEEAE